ncbi:MAG TPA: hypothetical protein VIJ12_01480 [Candidatus Baltobacteraceae bacterium]
MNEMVAATLGPWTNFYIIVGSAAAALTGLMFVVITLVISSERREGASVGTAAFSTPSVVSLVAALVVSAILVIPWRSLMPLAVVVGAAGIGGIAYIVRLILLAREFENYEADVEDWMWYWILPIAAYGAMLVAAFFVGVASYGALCAIAAAVLLHLLIGIHNAWDIVTYVAIERPEAERDGDHGR